MKKIHGKCSGNWVSMFHFMATAMLRSLWFSASGLSVQNGALSYGWNKKCVTVRISVLQVLEAVVMERLTPLVRVEVSTPGNGNSGVRHQG